MPLHVEFSTAQTGSPVENGLVEYSATITTGNATAFAAPQDGYFSVTPTEDGYVSFGPAVTAAAADPRRRVITGVTRSFQVPRGTKVGFTAG